MDERYSVYTDVLCACASTTGQWIGEHGESRCEPASRACVLYRSQDGPLTLLRPRRYRFDTVAQANNPSGSHQAAVPHDSGPDQDRLGSPGSHGRGASAKGRGETHVARGRQQTSWGLARRGSACGLVVSEHGGEWWDTVVRLGHGPPLPSPRRLGASCKDRQGSMR